MVDQLRYLYDYKDLENKWVKFVSKIGEVFDEFDDLIDMLENMEQNEDGNSTSSDVKLAFIKQYLVMKTIFDKPFKLFKEDINFDYAKDLKVLTSSSVEREWMLKYLEKENG